MDEAFKPAHSIHHLVLRKASFSDVQAIRDCLAAAFEPFRSQYTPGAFHDTVPPIPHLVKRLSKMTVLVTESESEVVGTIAYSQIDTDEGHLRGMAVLPQWQAQGVAKTLLIAAKTKLRAQDCRRVRSTPPNRCSEQFGSMRRTDINRQAAFPTSLECAFTSMRKLCEFTE